MRAYSIVVTAALLASCASTIDQQEARIATRDQALADFIATEELQEVDAIRSREQLSHRALSEKHIIIYDRKSSYLVIYRRLCRELRERDVVPDIRHEGNIIRAKFDTYRGCRIGTIYRVSQGQVDELMNLGIAPGQ